MSVQIKISQAGSGAPAGVAGESREDLMVGFDVLLEAIGGPFLQYQWTLVDKGINIETPALSTAAMSTPSASSTIVTPVDQQGTYLVELAVDAGFGLGARPEDIARNTFYAGAALNYLAADPADLPRREPAFRERTEHNVIDAIFAAGNLRGWAQEWLRWFAVIKRLYRSNDLLRAGACAYNEVIAGVAATPGWNVIGAFKLPKKVATIKLHTILLVSQAALTGRVRLYDTVAAAAVAGSTLTSVSTTDEEKNSADLSAVLTAGRLYYIESECTGGALPTDFAVIRHAIVQGY